MYDPNNATSAQQLIAESFGAQIFLQTQLDIQHTPVYDTFTVANNVALTALNTSFFTAVGQNKTLAQTNLTQPNRLQSPEAFSIFAFRLRWAENILLADALSLVNGLAFQFNLNKKDYNLAPLWHYNAGGGIFGSGGSVTTAAGTLNNFTTTNGVPGRESMHKLALPIPIENNNTFTGFLTGTFFTLTASGSGGTGLTLTAMLDGLYARGIQ